MKNNKNSTSNLLWEKWFAFYERLMTFLKLYVVPPVSRTRFLHSRFFMDIPNFPQITRSPLCPRILVTLLNDYLNFVVTKINANRGFLPAVRGAYERGARRVFLLNPERAGSAILLARDIREAFPDVEMIVLSDVISKKELSALCFLKDFKEELPIQKISGFSEGQNSVALCLNAWHRMTDEEKASTGDFLRKFDTFVIGEANNKSIWQLVGMLLFVPGLVLCMTPFIRPFRFSRLFLTYIVPIFPLILSLDGLAALFRLQSNEEIVARLSSFSSHSLSVHKHENGRGGRVNYVVGVWTQY